MAVALLHIHEPFRSANFNLTKSLWREKKVRRPWVEVQRYPVLHATRANNTKSMKKKLSPQPLKRAKQVVSRKPFFSRRVEQPNQHQPRVHPAQAQDIITRAARRYANHQCVPDPRERNKNISHPPAFSTTTAQGRRQGCTRRAAAQGPLKCGAPKLNAGVCAAMLVYRREKKSYACSLVRLESHPVRPSPELLCRVNHNSWVPSSLIYVNPLLSLFYPLLVFSWFLGLKASRNTHTITDSW